MWVTGNGVVVGVTFWAADVHPATVTLSLGTPEGDGVRIAGAAPGWLREP
jgi:hypothetical protein